MRKIIVAICGIMIVGIAIGDRTVSFPHVVDPDIADEWNAINGVTYDKSKYPLKDYFAPNWQFESWAGTFGVGNGRSGSAECKGYEAPDNDIYGTSDNEGSIVPIIARKIYKHGGKFCMTQMQAGWTWDTDPDTFFIDFFDDNLPSSRLRDGEVSPRYKCETICESGWYGDKCEKEIADIDGSTEGCPKRSNGTRKYKDYTKILNNRADGNYRLLCGKEKGIITTDVEVFKYTTQTAKDFVVEYIVLGVLDIEPNYVNVAPVKVTASHKKMSNAIGAADNRKVLCAPGFKLEESEQKTCVLRHMCAENVPGDDEWCEGFKKDDFNASEHSKTIYEPENQQSCWKLVCKAGANYAFEEGTKNCKSCGTTLHQGINERNECIKCKGDKPFWNANIKKCVAANDTLTAQQLARGKQNIFDCWREISQSDYKKCIECDQDLWNVRKHCCGTDCTSSN